MLIGAFLGPIAAILIFNSIVFAIVARTAIKHRRKTAKGTSAIGLIVRLIGIMILLGLTWVFGGLTVVSETSLAFQILFAIFNSSQGFFVFLFFCVLNKNTREAWKKILLRGRYKQSSSHPVSHIKDRYPQIPSSEALRSTLQNTSILDLQEQSANRISDGSEIGAIIENPFTDRISGSEGNGEESDDNSTHPRVFPVSYIEKSPEIPEIENHPSC